MVAKKVTQERVFTVANRLSKQGIVPTAKKLLAEIGVGSLTTHSKYLKQWQLLHDNHDNDKQWLSSTVTSLSSETAALFESAITQVWQQGVEQGVSTSQQEITHLKEQLATSHQQLEQIQDKLASIARAKKALSTLNKSPPNTPRKAFQGLALGGYHDSKDN